MLNHIIRSALNNRLIVLAIAIGLVVVGLLRVQQLSIDVLPDLTRPRVTLITECPGLAPEEVEALVTFPIETAVNGATGVTSVRSTSGIGLSVVYIDFDWGQDIYVARQIVNERMATVYSELPSGVTPQMGPISSLLGQIMLIGMWSEDGSTNPLELRTLGDWTVRTQLKTIDGVAQVITMGGGKMQYQVLVDPHLLHKYEVPLHDVELALQQGNLNVSGGYVQQGAREAVLRGIGRVRSIEDIESIVVANRASRPVLIRDVAQVKLGAQVKRGDSSVNGTDAVVLTVQKQPGADTRELSEKIRSTLKDLRNGLPKDVHLEVTYEQREFIDYSVNNVIEAVRDGALLVVVVLFLFLFNLRTTFITLTAIPLSILTTAVIFYWFGLSINVMTLGGIAVALGELVDDAIVDIENIFRRLKENRNQSMPVPALRVVYLASSEVRGAILMSTIMVVLVFAPLFALSGMSGRLFAPLGIAYIVSIVASTLVSLTVTPVLSYYLLSNARSTTRPDGFFLRTLKTCVRPLIRLSLLNWTFWPMAGVSLLATLVSGVIVWRMGKDFLPPFDEGAAQVNLFIQPGSSLETSTRIRRFADAKFQKLLKSAENPHGPLAWFTCKTGRAENDEHIMGVNTSEYVMAINPSSEKTRAELITLLRESLSDLAGVEVEVEQPIAHLISHMLSGVTAQIAIKVYGDDLRELIKLADEIKVEVAGVSGLAQPIVEPLNYIPQLQVELKRDQLAYYGITAATIHEMLETAFNGRVVSSVLDGQRTFDLLVRFDENSRAEWDALDRLPIELPDGTRQPLSELATVRFGTGPNQIKREDTRRTIVVRVNTDDRDLDSAVRDIKQAVQDKIDLPEGYVIEFQGQFEAQQAAARRLLLFSCLALAGVFIVLYSTLGSTRLAAQVLTALPIAFVGGVVALVLTGQALSVAGMVGFISLGGIAARNGILLIETYVSRTERDGLSEETIISGSLDRLAPVLMTALTTGIGLTPLIYNGQLPGKEILYPVATVIVGGLFTSTLAEFLLRPGMYWRLPRQEADSNQAEQRLSPVEIR